MFEWLRASLSSSTIVQRLGDIEIAQDVSELQSHRFRFIQVPTRVR